MIKRDGYLTSLWQDTKQQYTTQPFAERDEWDVIIVGGGITGISTALRLQEAGKRCLIIEAENLCFGTTGGTTAHINTLLDTPYSTIAQNFGDDNARLVANAAKEAVESIRNNIRQYNINCGFSEADAYLFAQDNSQEKELEGIFTATKAAGLSAAFTNKVPVPISFTKAICVKGQAKFQPLDYVIGLAEAYEKLGGAIIQHCRVTGVENNELVEVETAQGIFKARDLIYATHIPPGVNLVHLRCLPYRSYAMAVLLSDGKYPEDLSYDMYDPYHYYRTQVVDGQPYLIAGGKDHRTGDADNTEQHFLQLEATIRKHFAVAEIKYKWSSQYYESSDGLPYIGSLPGQPEHIYVATGFGGNGMTYSHVAAAILEKLIMNEGSPYIPLFDPNRLKPVAGFKNFMKHNLTVVKDLVSGFFPADKLGSLSGMAHGEGRIVDYEDDKVAIYKDEEGNIHALHTLCTHLKCEVKWNGAERSWDCPCHGARYDIDGNVLNGPADRGLEKR
jgi:glycine/D-amino acid oxidase-like deaminating enzyme/nitrite reductase/ring-hydroxylating ferredoxin subunit